MGNPRTFLFPDTNTFLHYPPLDQIDWHRVIGDSEITIVITQVVIRELNKHKDTPRSSKLRERAGAALRSLEAWSETELSVGIREGVRLSFQTGEPLIDFPSNRLSALISDDHLIASIIEHIAEYSADKHVLATDDLGLKLKARAFAIIASQIPASIRLPDESLESERKLAQLESKLTRLQNLVPKPRLAFAGNAQLLTIKMRTPRSCADAGVESLEATRARFPKRKIPEKRDAPYKFGNVEIPASALGVVDIKQAQVADYNDALEKFFSDYTGYFSEMEQYIDLQRRTSRIEMIALNAGTCPAEDADVFMHFPDGFELSDEDPLLKKPREPAPPTPPQSLSEMLTGLTRYRMHDPGLSGMVDVGSRYLVPAGPSNVGRVSIRRSNSFDVHVHIERLKHGLQEPLDTLFLTFLTGEEARSFTIEYSIHCANLPDPFAGQLHVKVENL